MNKFINSTNTISTNAILDTININSTNAILVTINTDSTKVSLEKVYSLIRKLINRLSKLFVKIHFL